MKLKKKKKKQRRETKRNEKKKICKTESNVNLKKNKTNLV